MDISNDLLNDKSRDLSCLTEIGSNGARKKRKGKKTEALENRVKQLTEAIEKQKIEFKLLQDKIKNSPGYTPRGQTTRGVNFDRFSQIYTEKAKTKGYPNQQNYSPQILN